MCTSFCGRRFSTMSYENRERDLKWARQIQDGDESAFESLFRTYADRLCAFADQYVGAPEVAEEIVQDLFFEIWRRRATWHPNTNVRAYLYKAARNKALDYLKHQRVVDEWKQQAGIAETAASHAPEENLRQKELTRAVQDAIDQLPERRRLIFILNRRHGMTYAEVAEMLNISIHTVETQMSRAFKTLRKLLAHCTSLLVLFL